MKTGSVEVSHQRLDVLIIGAGISGIGMACQLRRQHPSLNFVVLEARSAIGGTWDLFRYPGVRSDSDMYTFGYSFRPWDSACEIATGDAILEYLNQTIDEYGIRDSIRLGHRVQRFSWSSQEKCWTVQARKDGLETQFKCGFLVTGTGYFNYDSGYVPAFEGKSRFSGTFVHPQKWPKDLDYSGKRVLIIGSGATAVTLMPALAKKAEHVTLLQRSPTFVASYPTRDPSSDILRRWLPSPHQASAIRWKNALVQWLAFRASRKWPKTARQFFRRAALKGLGNAADVDVHFCPKYDPWEQRLCLSPDGDFFAALRDGNASIVTDFVERFEASGVRTGSGRSIDADIVVAATGLDLQFLGGASIEVDDNVLSARDLVSYRGMMFANVPNWVSIFGYTSASWTLKVEIVSDYVCRLLRFMRQHGHTVATPRADESFARTMPITTSLTSGYLRRGGRRMPRQGTARPWINHDDYLRDVIDIKWSPVDDGVISFR